jgi:hypothetical protein
MLKQTALALLCGSLAWPAMADLRPLQRPLSVEDKADPSFAPVNDIQPIPRPLIRREEFAATIAPNHKPLARPGNEDLSDPLMMVARDGTPAPQWPAPTLFGKAPFALSDITPLPASPITVAMAPELPASPLAVSVSPAAATAPEVLTTASTAGAAALPTMRPLARALPQTVAALRPKSRPEGLDQAVVVKPVVVATGLLESIRPEARPVQKKRKVKLQPEAEIIQAAVVTPAKPGKTGVVGKKGSVCGDPAIKGQTLAPITSKVNGCGIADPVRITSVAGVKLSQTADVDCDTAIALKSWIENGLQPQFGKNEVVQLQVAGSYACRPRNNVRGNKVSEHGRGNAIDISGLVLADGQLLTVQGDFGHKGLGQAMKAAHKAACGVFNTTLGPGSDGYHEDHMHFDVASGRGPYCR